LSYFTEKSAARPNIVLRILLAHDFDAFLQPMEGNSLFMNNYGSVKIYEEADVEIFRKRNNCKKIAFISRYDCRMTPLCSCLLTSFPVCFVSVPNFENFEEFHGRIQSIAYHYEGY